MISKNEMIAQLRGRRRSVEAEIKRVQEETPIDATRAATKRRLSDGVGSRTVIHH